MGIDGMRLALAAAAGMIGLAAMPAQAQDTSPENCIHAYSAAARLQSHVMGAAADGEGVHNLGGLTDNWLPTYVWEGRGRELYRKHADSIADTGRFLFGTSPEGQKRGDELYLEGASTLLFTMLTPEKVFAGQRALFAEVRACDLAHGFDPPLGVPPPAETILALLEEQRKRRDAQVLGRIDALRDLDDRQCAARFYVMGALMAQDPAFQQVMRTKMQVAAGKAREADPGFEPQRFLEMVQREAQERGSKMTKPEDVDPLLEEVNACETRYGQPLTKRN
jgi:hypothetical protein